MLHTMFIFFFSCLEVQFYHNFIIVFWIIGTEHSFGFVIIIITSPTLSTMIILHVYTGTTTILALLSEIVYFAGSKIYFLFLKSAADKICIYCYCMVELKRSISIHDFNEVFHFYA